MVATNASNVAFFDIETGKNVSTYYHDVQQQFTSISKSSKQSIIATTSSGQIILIGIPPFPYRFQKMLSFRHKDAQKLSASVGVRLSCFNVINRYFYVVDDKMYISCYNLSSLFNQFDKSQLSKQKIQFQRKNIVKDMLSRAKVQLLWQVKAHTQTIKNIIMTSSYDKKVKIWNAQTGQNIDSLQQNYNKPLPQPLAFYDAKKKYLYTKDRRKAFQNIIISPSQLDFDPFLYQKLRKNRMEYLQQYISNKQWKLKIKFQDLVTKQQQNFQQIMQQIKHLPEQQQKQNIQENKLPLKLQILQKHKKLMKQLNIQKAIKQGTLSHQDQILISTKRSNNNKKQDKKISANYYRRSILNSIQSQAQKNQTFQLFKSNILTNKKGQKSPDYTPIAKLLSNNEKNIKQIQHHKQYIQQLAKKDTQNIINNRKKNNYIIGKQDVVHANRFYTMLKSCDSQTRFHNLPLKFVLNLSSFQQVGKYVQKQEQTLRNLPKCLTVGKSHFGKQNINK